MIGAKILAGIVLYVGYQVKKSLGPIHKWLKAGWANLIGQILLKFVSLLAKTASNIIKAVVDGLAWVIKAIINGVLDGVAWLIKALSGLIIDAIAWYIKTAIDTFGGMIAAIISLFSEDTANEFRKNVLYVGKGIVDKGADIAKGINSYITDGVNTVVQAITNPIIDGAAGLVKFYNTWMLDLVAWGVGWAADIHKSWALEDSDSDSGNIESASKKMGDDLSNGKTSSNVGGMVQDVDITSDESTEGNQVNLDNNKKSSKTPNKSKKLDKEKTKPKITDSNQNVTITKDVKSIF